MISHQVIQSSLEELRGITRIDLCVLETDGSQVASTFDASGITLEMTRSFAQSPAEGQNLQGCHFFKYMMKAFSRTSCLQKAAATTHT